MILTLDPSSDIVAEMCRAINNAAKGDIIVTPTIHVYNNTMKLLAELRPDVLIYVRMESFEYYPAIGVDNDVKPNDAML